MHGLKNTLTSEYFLVFMFCMAVIIGPAISMLFEYNLAYFPDCKSYLGLAELDFVQSPVRRYRVIIPFSAGALNYLFGGAFARFAPAYFAGNFSLPFSFFLVNSALMSFFGLLIYRYCRAFGTDRISALAGVLVMLTCRYTFYLAAYPMVDSLFCVIVSLTLSGIKLKNTNMLLWAIFLGPFAKESFILVAPLIFFFSHLHKSRMAVYFILSGLLVFAYRYMYDVYLLTPVTESLKADFSHLTNTIRYVPKLFSLSTLAKILMNTGLWFFAPLLLFFINPHKGRVLLKQLDRYLIFFMISVVLQMLLSGSMERMFYLAMPVICAIVALSVQELRKLIRIPGV